MKAFCFAFFIGIAHLVYSQKCSESIKVKANSSRYITLCNDNEQVLLAHIDSNDEIDEINVLAISGSIITAENKLSKGCFYSGNCRYENNYRLFYFKAENKETFSLCGLTGNSKNPVASHQESIVTLSCEYKQLPKYLYAVENTQGLYICVPSYTSGKEKTSIQLLVLDKSMQLIREKKLALPYGDNTLETVQILPDSAGNIYILSKQRIHSRAKNIPARYFLFYYNFQRNALKEYDMQLHGKNISGAFLDLTATSDVIVAGFFSNDMTMHTAGVFHSTIKPQGGSMSGIKIQAFRDFGMDSFIDSRSKSANIPDLELDGVFVDTLGISIWGERRYSTEHSGIDPLTGRVYNEIRHHNDEIIMARIDTSGHLIFNGIIQKQQVTTGETQFMSYHTFHDMKSIHFAYNDHPSNMAGKRNETNVWYSSKNFVCTIATISPQEEIRYTPLVIANDLRIIPRLSSGKMIVTGEGKVLRICKME
jgi:hypothetical protein